jgi:hypothetical protein
VTQFRFRLERVLAYRRLELEQAEARFRQGAAALAGLDRRRAELDAAGARSEGCVRAWSPLAGQDLAALDHFRFALQREERDLAARRAEACRRLAALESEMMEARRRCRLLERLRERRLAEWEAERGRELEALASESYLARWSAGRPADRS